MSAIDELMTLLEGGGAAATPAPVTGGVPPTLAATPQPSVSTVIPSAPVSAPGKHGIDWQKLIDLAIPMTGAFMGNPGQRTGFMNGYARGTELARQHKAEQDQIKQRQAQSGADFLLKIGEHAQGFDDPVALDQFLSVADEAGTKAGFNQPGQIRGRFTVPQSTIAKKRLVEISGQLDQLEKNGYDLDQLASSGSHIQLSDGTSVPMASALQITRRRPMDTAGAPITKPPKAASTEEERFIAKRAKDYGYTSLDDVDADTQLQWREDFRASGRADKTVDPASPAAQLNSLVTLWKAAHQGQQPPENVMVQLRKQANQVNDKPTGGDEPIQPDDVQGAAQAILSGRMAPSQLSLVGGMGNRGVKFKQAVVAAVNKAQPQFNWQESEANFQFGKNTGTQNTVRYLDSVSESMPLLLDRANKLNNGQIRGLNSLINAGKNQVNNVDLKQFQTDVTLVADEVAKILQGGGTGNGTSDAKLRQASSMLNTSDSPAAIAAALGDINTLLGNRRRSLTRGTFLDKGESGGSSNVTHRFNPTTGKVDVVKP